MRRESNRNSKEQQNYMALLGIPSSVGSQSSHRSQQKGPPKERDIISVEQPLESSFSSLPEIQEIDEDDENRTKSGASSRRQTGVQMGDGKEYE